MQKLRGWAEPHALGTQPKRPYVLMYRLHTEAKAAGERIVRAFNRRSMHMSVPGAPWIRR